MIQRNPSSCQNTAFIYREDTITFWIYETQMPPAAKKLKSGKFFKSYILTPSPGYIVSVKCGKPWYEITVQIWLLYDHPNFKYCTLYVGAWTELWANGHTNYQITRLPIRLLWLGKYLPVPLFSDLLSPAFKSRYGWNISKTTKILKTTIHFLINKSSIQYLPTGCWTDF